MSTNILDFVSTATKEQSRLRLALSGPSGSGKTFSAVNILTEMGCQKIIVLDTEHGSAAKYSNSFARPFEVVDNRFWKSNFDPRILIRSLKQLAAAGYDGIIVDSLTHFWMGPGGMLTLVDEFAKRAKAKFGKYDSYGAWKEADPIYNELIQTILALPCHFVGCLRAKTEYTRTDEGGKTKVQKTGMAAQIREGFEYEFDVEGLMDMDHNLSIGKTRCSDLDGRIFHKPGKNIAEPLVAWLTDGVPPAPQQTSVIISETPADTKETGQPGSGPSVKESLIAEAGAAKNAEDLSAVSKRANAAKKNGEIAGDDWKEVAQAFAARRNELVAASEPATESAAQ